jgi:hypothetical protein
LRDKWKKKRFLPENLVSKTRADKMNVLTFWP